MTSVKMIYRNPIEFRFQISLNLVHQVPDEGFEVFHLRAVFGRNDEAELIPVARCLLDKDLAVSAIRISPIEFTRLPFPRDAIALDITQMGASSSQITIPEPRDPWP